MRMLTFITFVTCPAVACTSYCDTSSHITGRRGVQFLETEPTVTEMPWISQAYGTLIAVPGMTLSLASNTRTNFPTKENCSDQSGVGLGLDSYYGVG